MNSTLTVTTGVGHMAHYAKAQEIAASVNTISEDMKAASTSLSASFGSVEPYENAGRNANDGLLP
jgi:hypothetical protein